MQKIFQYVDEEFPHYVEELSALCACRSVAGDQEGLGQAKQILLDKLEALEFSVKTYSANDVPPVIEARKTKQGKPKLLFYNHYDVVPEGRAEEWQSPPFCPAVRDGRLWGRGVSDNKGALMARLQAIEAILAVNGKLPVEVAYILDGQEETGSAVLAKLVQENAEAVRAMTDADLCFWENGRTLPDKSPEAAFGVRSTLSIELKVQTTNGDEHGRMGAELPNAAWRLSWALASLKDTNEHIKIDGFYDDVLPPQPYDLDVLEDYPLDEKAMLARKGIPAFLLGLQGSELKKKIFLQPSLTICGLSSGEPWKGFRNIVPSVASARLSVILVPNQKAEDILQKLKRHLKEHGFSDIEVVATGEGFPVRTPLNNPWRQVLERAAEHVYEKPLTPSITQLGSGPAYLLRTVRPNLPIICACGVAGLDSGHHSTKESIWLENYKNGIKYTIATLYEAAKCL